KVVRRYEHDQRSFTQGLEFDGEDTMLEGTGLYGKSLLRRLRYKDSKVLQETALDEDLFGEGITVYQDFIVQLTWKENVALVYDKNSLERKGSFTYPYEGWGAVTMGDSLITTDGTNVLSDLASTGVAVRIAIRLNELENVEGELWANLWPTETIIRIDPKSGRILGWVDLRGLRRECEKIAGPMKQLDVLNGIAFHKGSQGRKLIVTGKWWPRSFEI
ncbi:hypothetical protein GUITHDRAFT_55786, partial [Guillardia theta CCMP2712]